jgi:hypothetical protein
MAPSEWLALLQRYHSGGGFFQGDLRVDRTVKQWPRHRYRTIAQLYVHAVGQRVYPEFASDGGSQLHSDEAVADEH